MIRKEILSRYFRKCLAIGSFLWSVQLLYPAVFHPETIRSLDGGFANIVVVVLFDSSWFWSILFFIPVLAYIIGEKYAYKGRWVLVLEGMLGFFVWMVATIMFYVEYIPVGDSIHHLMQPFTPYAVMSGNILITYFAWCNMLYLWDNLQSNK